LTEEDQLIVAGMLIRDLALEGGLKMFAFGKRKYSVKVIQNAIQRSGKIILNFNF
jgi:hypothetical protein